MEPKLPDCTTGVKPKRNFSSPFVRIAQFSQQAWMTLIQLVTVAASSFYVCWIKLVVAAIDALSHSTSPSYEDRRWQTFYFTQQPWGSEETQHAKVYHRMRCRPQSVGSTRLLSMLQFCSHVCSCFKPSRQKIPSISIWSCIVRWLSEGKASSLSLAAHMRTAQCVMWDWYNHYSGGPSHALVST